ncbi:MAG: hypothetical protein RI957_1218 [Verrucomicrobiota bacterium]|jgi:hypothetical protein
MLKKPCSSQCRDDCCQMVGLAGLPALRSGYAKVQPAPPQAELVRCAYQARRVRTGSLRSPFSHSTCREIKKAILG